MSLKTNMRMRFMLPWEGAVIHRDSKQSTIQFPEGYEFRANILTETEETLDLEIVDTVGRHAVVIGGDWIQNVPLMVLAINKKDVDRVCHAIAESN
ncbi:MAG: hypothetical protein M0R80_07590 [Proteobacteria bacterium]|nr:hypothetical protein [Pseudomonadota bacterium]